MRLTQKMTDVKDDHSPEGRKAAQAGRQRRRQRQECEYHVQLYSESATLVREFSLDAQEHGLANLEAAEEHLRQTLTPGDFTSTVSLTTGRRGRDEQILQFRLGPA